MINFYLYYNGEMDYQHYASLIDQVQDHTLTKDLVPIAHIIKKLPKKAYFYSRDIIKGRWPEAEPYIMTKPASACWYAIDIIKGRWPEAESIIKENDYLWKLYCWEFGI